MVAELRTRSASLYKDPSVPVSSVLSRKIASPLIWRRWKCLLLSCVLYSSFFLISYVCMNKRDNEDEEKVVGSFISAASLDKANWNYLRAHQDRELKPKFSFIELEMDFLYSTNLSRQRDKRATAEAEAYSKMLLPFPVSESKIRRLRCVGWRATDDCSPQGTRIPHLDKSCTKVIPFGTAGYCEVMDKDTGEAFRVMQRYCSSVRDTAKFRCAEAWDFAVFPQKAREAVRSAQNRNIRLPNVVPKSDDQQQPRDGVVMVVYPKLLASAYATIRALRTLYNCDLPIELWFRSHEMKYVSEAFAHFQQWSSQSNGSSITFREIDKPGVTGFATKVFAIYHSFFERVLFLDADNTPVRNPTFLFESPEFEANGAVFWPDFWHPGQTIFNIQPHSLVWELLDLPFVNMFEQESGQLLIDRRRHAAPLELVNFYMFHRPNHFDKLKLAHGDKDLFRFAWLKLGASFHMIKSPPAVAGKVINESFCGMTMVQYDARGEVLFLHRNSHKLTGTPRRKAVHMMPAAVRRARIKRLRIKMAEADRSARNGNDTLEDISSPTLEAPEPDGYPDRSIWTHLVAFKSTSRRSNYSIGTYNADPEFDKDQSCYGRRYQNESQHFVTQSFAELSFAGLEAELRRFAMEGAHLYEREEILD